MHRPPGYTPQDFITEWNAVSPCHHAQNREYRPRSLTDYRGDASRS
jgi:hypothetical protein